MMTPEFFDLVSHIYTFSILHSFIYITFFSFAVGAASDCYDVTKKASEICSCCFAAIGVFFARYPTPGSLPIQQKHKQQTTER